MRARYRYAFPRYRTAMIARDETRGPHRVVVVSCGWSFGLKRSTTVTSVTAPPIHAFLRRTSRMSSALVLRSLPATLPTGAGAVAMLAALLPALASSGTTRAGRQDAGMSFQDARAASRPTVVGRRDANVGRRDANVGRRDADAARGMTSAGARDAHAARRDARLIPRPACVFVQDARAGARAARSICHAARVGRRTAPVIQRRAGS
jgi:hypothetical protein